MNKEPLPLTQVYSLQVEPPSHDWFTMQTSLSSHGLFRQGTFTKIELKSLKNSFSRMTSNILNYTNFIVFACKHLQLPTFQTKQLAPYPKVVSVFPHSRVQTNNQFGYLSARGLYKLFLVLHQ